jgi:calcineurin-like phosphoesterase family protein
MFGRSNPAITPRGPKGCRAYVVGDVHGRLDLLDRLLDDIHAEIDRDKPGKVLLVFLGDLIDRGPSSAQVVERLRTYRHQDVRPVFLLGNHEEVMLRLLAGEAGHLPGWLRFGGAQCLQSYGADPRRIAAASDASAMAAIRDAIPDRHAEFLRTFVDTCRFGDYLFVHAGIRPGVEIDQQRQLDLRWIREPFLSDETEHGFVVVHGHTISPEVEERANRIGIDTGAYRSGVLTALAIEGDRRWYLRTAAAVGTPVSATH